MPFNTAFIVNNIGLSVATLPTIYLVTGLCMVFMGPLVGKLSDSFGKFPTFYAGSVLAIPMIAIWTNLGRVSLAAVIVVNVVLFIGTFSRLVSSQALISAVPEATKRGAFNAFNVSLQQLAGGVSAAIAGAVIFQGRDGALQNFNWLGYIVMAVIIVSLLLMYFVHRQVPERMLRGGM
jgi:predicted MFS family arabinose efflux permease